jgi:glucokinase
MTFGGGDSPLGREVLQTVREEFNRRTFPTLKGKIIIDFASLGGDAGYLGAAGLARLDEMEE